VYNSDSILSKVVVLLLLPAEAVVAVVAAAAVVTLSLCAFKNKIVETKASSLSLDKANCTAHRTLREADSLSASQEILWSL
jgi:hypothetical protein